MHDPHLHLLIDDHEVTYRTNLTRFIERPERLSREPVLRPEMPWEGRAVSLWGSVVHDGEQFQMWYLGTTEPRGRMHSAVCYATSPDGFNWTRGDFDLYPHPSAQRNNIVFRDEREPEIMRTHPFTVILDREDGDSERRYKLIGYMNDAERTRGYTIGFSPDGIHWSYPPRVHVPRGDRTTVMQDFIRGGFVMASRGDQRDRDRDAGHLLKRDIALSRSPDCLEWTPGVRVFTADDDDLPATEFYGMPMFVWGNQYIGLLEYYDPLNEILNVQLTTSRDGDHWERAVSRQTWFDVGPSDSWESTWVAFGFNPPHVQGDDMLFWYTGRPVAHGRSDKAPLRGSIGIARAPRDRFAGLRAGPGGGELTTDWVEVGGPRLLLNIGAANGPLSVSVTGEDARPIDGFGHADCDLDIAEGVDVAASWNGRDLAPLVGQRVRLQIKITYATLYAYRFA
jgi:hypothetical protein